MANILEIFTTAWTSMPEDRRQKIMDEVSPNKVVRGVLYSLSSYYEAQRGEESVNEEAPDDDIIDVEFSESKLDDGFGV